MNNGDNKEDQVVINAGRAAADKYGVTNKFGLNSPKQWELAYYAFTSSRDLSGIAYPITFNNSTIGLGIVRRNNGGAVVSETIGSTYKIKPGDTLSGIAAATGFTVQELAEYNGIADPNKIYAGDTLWIPTKIYDSSWLRDNEYGFYQGYNDGYFSGSLYSGLNSLISTSLLSNSINGGYTQGSSWQNLTLDPIGAFYDSQSSTYDNAVSIADKTGVLVDGQGRKVSVATLQGLDTNHDGVLSVAEASGLRLLTDLNENGHLDACELNAVTSEIWSVDWSKLTRGNALMSGMKLRLRRW